MHEHLTRAEVLIVLLIACYGGLMGAALVIAYALARSG